MTLNAYLNRFRSVNRSNHAMSWNACNISMALFQVLQVFWRNNVASMVENTSSKPLKMPFLRLKRLKLSLDASALKNLGLWCKFQSHLLFIISLLLENFLTALLTCLLDSACAISQMIHVSVEVDCQELVYWNEILKTIITGSTEPSLPNPVFIQLQIGC